MNLEAQEKKIQFSLPRPFGPRFMILREHLPQALRNEFISYAAKFIFEKICSQQLDILENQQSGTT